MQDQQGNHVMTRDQLLVEVWNRLFLPKSRKCPVVEGYYHVSSHSIFREGERRCWIRDRHSFWIRQSICRRLPARWRSQLEYMTLSGFFDDVWKMIMIHLTFKWPLVTWFKQGELGLSNDLPVGEGDISKFFSSSAVNFISESRMIRIKFGSVGQNLICESIKLGDMLLWVFNSFLISQSESNTLLTNEKWENIENRPEGTKEGYRLHHLES